jgi:hypothetical protein
MAKSRNRSRDARKRAAKKRKNRLYQEHKRKLISINPLTSEMTPNFNAVITDVEEPDGTRQQDS